MCDFQSVNLREWLVADGIEKERRKLLEDPQPAAALLREVRNQAEVAALAGKMPLVWQEARERTGFGRLECRVSMPSDLWDQFFNGRTGYRAQYYRSPDCGAAYNRAVVHALSCAVKIAYAKAPLAIPLDETMRSLLGSWSKIWVVGDGATFDSAPVGIDAPRWAEYWKERNGNRGLKIPNPCPPQLDLKGSFIDSSGTEWVDPLKECRSVDIFRSGWS